MKYGNILCKRALILGGFLAGLALAPIFVETAGFAQDADKRVLDAETKRIAAVDRVKPTVLAIFSSSGQGGGSGVLISKDGYALTNFHVVEGSGPVMQCGLDDGVLYDAVLVGLDKVGDVALIKVLPKKEGQPFPFAVLGDSDKVKAGDWSLAMGNPFLLATDFHPTVTFGLISGVHRYQYPAGTLLEYTDCIQIDTSINPGNSGGPLFNMDGELIGINGRGSFEKRGRVNSGVGYAISINQIKNFMGHMKAGIDTDHATLGATVTSSSEEGPNNKLVVNAILEDSDARRRGLDEGDELVTFAGRPMTTVNQYKNVLGLFPKEWRVPLVYRRNNEKKEILVRLQKLQQTQNLNMQARPRPTPGPPRPKTPPRFSPATKFYEPKPGFANYYFNKVERDRLLAEFRKHGDFSAATGPWTFDAMAADAKKITTDVKVTLSEEMEDKGPDDKPLIREGTYHLKSESLPDLPDAKEDTTPLRKAVRSAMDLMRKHARSFPQEVWAQATDAELKEQITETQKDVVVIQGKLQETLDNLAKLAPDRAKENLRWQAFYDFTQARLGMFIAHINEYNYMLAQLKKEPPKRDPKIHRGWRMLPDEKIQSGADTKKLASDADKILEKMSKDKNFKATVWEERAVASRKIQLGLKWVATGGTKTMVRLNLGSLKFELDPLKVEQPISNLKEPKGSGGLLAALYHYRRFLTLGPAGFEGRCDHHGFEPFYPFPEDGSQPKSLADLRTDAEVIFTEHAAVDVKWYFSKKDYTLMGFELSISPDDDPCEVYLSDYRMVDGRLLPHRMEVRNGNDLFSTLTIKNYQIASAK